MAAAPGEDSFCIDKVHAAVVSVSHVLRGLETFNRLFCIVQTIPEKCKMKNEFSGIREFPVKP
jgi:hypothetical protein